MARKYELLYFKHVGDSAPLDTKEELASLLNSETTLSLKPSEISIGETFSNGEELILLSAYDEDNEEEEL